MDADGNFDVVIMGTGLTESITAAALSKAGFKVAHIDSNAYYGGDEASLTADELAQWADNRSSAELAPTPYLTAQRTRFTSLSRSETLPDHARHYSISLAPSLIPSVGPFTASLVSSGVARYGGYRLLERVGMYSPSTRRIQNVPASKEDVFKSKDMSLLEKRRLMRFLMFAADEFEDKKELQGQETTPFLDFLKSVFSLNQAVSEAIAYALAFCMSPSENTLSTLTRLRSYLRSSGRYGSSSFLVGHYGGLGEIAQGFCRVSAVNGGVYILDRLVRKIVPPSYDVISSTAEGNTSPESLKDQKYILELEDFPEQMTADVLIASPDLLPPNLAHLVSPSSSGSNHPTPNPPCPVARAIVLIDSPIPFPPSASSESLATTSDVPSEQTEDPSASATPSGKSEDDPVDTFVIVFPPASVEGGSTTSAVHAFVTGQGTMSAPKGKYIIHVALTVTGTLEQSPAELLKPYVAALLALVASPAPDPLFTLFYLQTPALSSTPLSASVTSLPDSSSFPSLFTTPPLPLTLTTTSDEAANAAEQLFFSVVSALRTKYPELKLSDETERTKKADEVEGILGEEVKGSGTDLFAEIKFWPPLENDAQEEAVDGDDW